jgi:hypothetical protein
MPEDFPPTGAVNLALINTTPEQLAAMAKAKGVFATECNGQGMGPSALTPEQPPAATHGPPFPKKEALHLPIEQPVQPRWDTDLQQAEKANRGDPPCPEASQNALKHSVQQASVQEPPPTPGSPAWHKLRIEELDRLRAEWRRGP